MPRFITRTAFVLALVAGFMVSGAAPSSAQTAHSSCNKQTKCQPYQDWCIASAKKAGLKHVYTEIAVGDTSYQTCHLYR